MALIKFSGVGISAMSACVPSNISANSELGYLVPQDALKKLIRFTGIEEKRIVDSGVCASDLCFKAAENLMEENNIEKASIDMLLFLSLSPDFISPPTSTILQDKLGLPVTTGALDLSMACSGFVYALSTAFAFAATEGVNRVLVLVGETMSKYSNPNDRVNFPLYGDAGTACLVEKGDYKDSYFMLSSDGRGSDLVKIPSGGARNPADMDSLKDKEREDGNIRRDVDITMDGLSTFNHAVSIIPKQVKDLMRFANITHEDVDYFVSHQANKFMIDFITKRLKFPKEKVPFCIKKYGNTSAASIPLTIVSELVDKLESDHSMLLSAIGAGWSFGTAFLQNRKIKITRISDY